MAGKRSIETGRAHVKAWLDDSAVSRGIKKMRRSFSSAGRGLMSVGGGMLAGAAGIAALFIKPISAASDLQETMSKFDTVFGDRAGAVKQWGDQLADTIGRGKTEVAGFLANTQDLLVPLGFEAGAAEDMSKQVTGLAYDLASFNNMQDADVVRDLHAALTGSGEVMKKYGVVVSEAAVKQELLNQGLDPKKATEAQKANARFALILKGTTAAQGDAEKTAGSWANQKKRLAAQIQNVSETIGTALLPVLTPLLTKLSAGIGWIGGMISKGAHLVKWVFAIAAGMAAAGLAITGLGLAFTIAGSVIGGVMAVVSGLVSAFFFLVSPIGLILAALAAAGAAGAYFAYQSGLMGEAIDWLKDKFGPLAEQAMAAFKVIKDALAAGELGAAARVAMAALRLAFASAMAWIQGKWIDFSAFMASVMLALGAQIEGIWSQVATSMFQMVAKALNGILSLTAALDRMVGLDDLAMKFEAIAFGANVASGVAGTQNENEQAAIDKRRLDSQEQLEAESAKKKEKLNEGVERATDDLNTALANAITATSDANAKAAADAAKKKIEEQKKSTDGGGGAVAKAAKPAINTAVMVGTQAAQDAAFKALGGSVKGITPGDRLLATAIDQQTAAMARQHREAMRKEGGGTLKVEKTT